MPSTSDPERRRGLRPTSLIDKRFGPWLRRQRVNNGWTQEDFARRSRVARNTIALLERSEKRETAIALAVFSQVADALDLELAYVLHKAGFDIGAGGIKLARLQAVESVLEVLATAEAPMRTTLAQMLERMPDDDPLLPQAARSLALLDLTVERLRENDFAPSAFMPEPDQTDTTERAWTEDEEEFIRQHPRLTNEDLARALSRSVEAVRQRRREVNNKTNERSSDDTATSVGGLSRGD